MKTEYRYGRKIQEEREKRAWTQEQLATIASVDTRTIQRVEKDQTKNPETLQAIAAAFDLDLSALRTTWRIAESRLIATRFVASHAAFIHAEEAHHWHAFTRSVMVPLKDELREKIDDLCDRVFADRELIEPYEIELWKSYVECIRDPLQSLFELGFAFYLLDERKDLLLPRIGADLQPTKDHIDDWTIRYFVLVPRHGCFHLDKAAPLHRFDQNCRAAGEAMFLTHKRGDTGAYIYKNAIYAMSAAGGDKRVNWCDACFPLSSSGERLDFDYLEQITGLSRSQLHELCKTVGGEPFLQGLS